MLSSADKLIRKCELAIAKGELDDARKLAKGVSILTGQSAWQKAYEVFIDGEELSRFVTLSQVDIPEWLPGMLHDLHETKGKYLANQSARGGTQVTLTHDKSIVEWLDQDTLIGAWSTRLSSGGHHINHIHPRGDRSHVIYIEVPDRTSGHLQFGVTRYSDRKPSCTVIPEEGLMVSFPCWLWHGVTEYTGEGHRLTVAFDSGVS